MSRTFAVVMVAAILVCVAGTRKEIPFLRPNPGASQSTRMDFVRRDLGGAQEQIVSAPCSLGLLLASLVFGVELAFYPFMGIHFWGFQTEQLFYLAYVGLFAFPVSFALTPVITRLIDKRLTVMLTLAASILALNVPICLRLLGRSVVPKQRIALGAGDFPHLCKHRCGDQPHPQCQHRFNARGRHRRTRTRHRHSARWISGVRGARRFR